MILDEYTVKTSDPEQLIGMVRAWYDHTAAALPNRILRAVGELRAAHGGPSEWDRALLLAIVRRHGPLQIPEGFRTTDPEETGLAGLRTRSPYPRARIGARRTL
jgi:hypothetical protein